MTRARSLAVAVLSGALIAAFTGLLWRWPIPVAVGLSVVVAVVALATSAALGRDTRAEDAAWRQAAPELQDPPGGPAD